MHSYVLIANHYAAYRRNVDRRNFTQDPGWYDVNVCTDSTYKQGVYLLGTSEETVERSLLLSHHRYTACSKKRSNYNHELAVSVLIDDAAGSEEGPGSPCADSPLYGRRRVG